MPAVSKKQKTAMCMALAARKGDLEVSKLKGAALDIYKSDMTNKEIEEFTVLKEHVELAEYTKQEMKNLKDFILESKHCLGDYSKKELEKMGYSVTIDGKVYDKKGKFIGDMSDKNCFLEK